MLPTVTSTPVLDVPTLLIPSIVFFVQLFVITLYPSLLLPSTAFSLSDIDSRIDIILDTRFTSFFVSFIVI